MCALLRVGWRIKCLAKSRDRDNESFFGSEVKLKVKSLARDLTIGITYAATSQVGSRESCYKLIAVKEKVKHPNTRYIYKKKTVIQFWTRLTGSAQWGDYATCMTKRTMQRTIHFFVGPALCSCSEVRAYSTASLMCHNEAISVEHVYFYAGLFAEVACAVERASWQLLPDAAPSTILRDHCCTT